MQNRVERYAVWLFAAAAIALSLMLLNACAAPTPTAVPTPNLFNLADTKWTLTAMTENGETRALLSPMPTLNFETERLGGNATCNTYSGDYKTQGEIIQVSALRSTLMACADANAMAQESMFLNALQNARMFELRENVLKITFGEGKGQLEFARSTK
jgi:heat shock protein HslJ